MIMMKIQTALSTIHIQIITLVDGTEKLHANGAYGDMTDLGGAFFFSLIVRDVTVLDIISSLKSDNPPSIHKVFIT